MQVSIKNDHTFQEKSAKMGIILRILVKNYSIIMTLKFYLNRYFMCYIPSNILGYSLPLVLSTVVKKLKRKGGEGQI
jgi:hypothetical protein